MASDLSSVWPRPQRIELLGTRVSFETIEIELPNESEASQRQKERILAELAKQPGQNRPEGSYPRPWRLQLVLDQTGAKGREGYRLEIGPESGILVAAEAPGLQHAVSTLLQLLRDSRKRALPCLRIEDWPRLERRGILLDVSRDKVPTMTTLFGLLEHLAEWKINEFQLYFEHVFAYRGHEQVWKGASPFLPEEIRELDEFCSQRHIELVPNQNSFGHFHRWLVHEPYRALAECPEGIEHPFSSTREPFSLCATDPRALDLLRDLYDQLLPNFRSSRFNVGLDETFDLGQGRSAEACRTRGKGEVYLDFVGQVHDLAAERGRRIQLWADILLHHPELLHRLPSDCEALIWGYEADHPFDSQCRVLAEIGRDFYVCPGTSSWLSFAGRLPNALDNQLVAVSAAEKYGARGCLITEWGDQGHLQPLPISEVALFLGAGMSWNPSSEPSLEELGGQLDRFVFEDRRAGLGQVAVDLGQTYLDTQAQTRNGSALFHLLVGRRPPETIPGLTAAGLELASGRLETARQGLAASEASVPKSSQAKAELLWVTRILTLACQLGQVRLQHPGCSLSDLPLRARRDLATELRSAIEQRAELWALRNRPGGLSDALQSLRQTLLELNQGRTGNVS